MNNPTFTASQPKQLDLSHTSTWIRFAAPFTFAILAAICNTIAIEKHIGSHFAVELTADLPIGTVLLSKYLRIVKVAGDFDKRQLVAPADLAALLSPNEHPEKAEPFVLSRAIRKGELLTKSSLGGRGTVQAGTNQELIQVPRSIIRGQGKNLVPGQFVYFLVKKRNDEKSDPIEIGPFQVAIEARTNVAEKVTERDSINIIYAVGENGTRSDAAKWLHSAVFGENAYVLAVIEKPLPKRTEEKVVSMPSR